MYKRQQEGTGAKRQSINEAREYGEYIGDNVPKFRNNRDIWTINTLSLIHILQKSFIQTTITLNLG